MRFYTLLSCGFIHYSNAFSSSINAFSQNSVLNIYYMVDHEEEVNFFLAPLCGPRCMYVAYESRNVESEQLQ